MTPETRRVLKFVFKLVYDRYSFFFWLFVRFLSALFPLFSVYLFSRTIQMLEQGTNLSHVFWQLFFILLVFILDNFTRLISVHQLQFIISNTEFAIHQFFLIGLSQKDKFIRHEAIQSIRNFAEAARTTLELIRQPGIDSFVSLLSIPAILFFLDFKVFILEIAYIVIYYFTDVYTTQKYISLREIQNIRTEVYFAKLQDSNEVSRESGSYTKNFAKLCAWGFWEWFTLQNIAVIFYSLTLFYLTLSVSGGAKHISDLVLIIGYIGQTQTHLNSFSAIKDRLADTQVALLRLARSRHILSLHLKDLVS
jgi:hypothetical protein